MSTVDWAAYEPVDRAAYEPVDWAAYENLYTFLAIFFLLLAAAVGWYRWRVTRRRPGGAASGVALTEEELAYLIGGPNRLAETVLVGLVTDGRVRVNSEGRLSQVVDSVGHQSAAVSAPQARLLAAVGSGMTAAERALREVALSPAAAEIRERLIARGLLRPPWPPGGGRKSRKTWKNRSEWLKAIAFVSMAMAVLLLAILRQIVRPMRWTGPPG